MGAYNVGNKVDQKENYVKGNNIGQELKGMIRFPCCEGEKVLIYKSARGKTSIKCPRCRKFALFDFDNMQSIESRAIRGASHTYRNK